MMNIYKIYIATKKKDGTIIKSEGVVEKSTDKEKAIESAIKVAKESYGYKGKIHICSVFIRNDNKQFIKI